MLEKFLFLSWCITHLGLGAAPAKGRQRCFSTGSLNKFWSVSFRPTFWSVSLHEKHSPVWFFIMPYSR